MTLEEFLQEIRECGNIRRYYEKYTGEDADCNTEYLGFAAFCTIDAFIFTMKDFEKSALYQNHISNIEEIQNEFVYHYNTAIDYVGLANAEFTPDNRDKYFHGVMCAMALGMIQHDLHTMIRIMTAFEAQGYSSPYQMYFMDSVSEYNFTLATLEDD